MSEKATKLSCNSWMLSLRHDVCIWLRVLNSQVKPTAVHIQLPRVSVSFESPQY